MAHLTLTFYSTCLEKRTNCCMYLPENLPENRNDFQCLYLLHGLSDNELAWPGNTSVERYAQDKRIAVVMPDGEKSFYTDLPDGSRYYSYIAEELPDIITNMFNISKKREDTFIAGNSMGGYGAIKIALKNSHRFCACAGLSPVADIKTHFFKDKWKYLFGNENAVPKEEDLFELVKNNIENTPKIFITIGKDDFLFPDNIAFVKHMKNYDFDFTFIESEGNHNWSFWDDKIQDAINWFLK